MRVRAGLLFIFLLAMLAVGQGWAPSAPAAGTGMPAPPGPSAGDLRKLGAVPMAGFTTDFAFATPGQAHNIGLAAERLRGLVVQPGKTFSFNAAVGPRTPQAGFQTGRIFVGDRIVQGCGGGVCQVATTLYNVVLLADLPVLERHRHSLTVPYVPPGQDATVAWNYADFRFRNNLNGPLLLWSRTEGRRLTISLYGPERPPKVVVKHRILATYPFTTQTLVNASLPPGTEKVVTPGQPGVKVESWLEIESPGGLRRKDLGIDVYRPSPRIVELGPPVIRCSELKKGAAKSCSCRFAKPSCTGSRSPTPT